jgi:hypothetical protein
MATETQTTNRSQQAMANDRQLFLLSNLVDTVRDTARDLLGLTSPTDTTAATSALIQRYNTLLADISDLVPAADRDLLGQWAPTLNDDATLGVILDAAATLARIVDVHIGVDAYIAQRVQQRLDINTVLAHAPAAYPEPEPSAPESPSSGGLALVVPSASDGHGQYL